MGPILVMPMLKAVKNGVISTISKKLNFARHFGKWNPGRCGCFVLKCPRGSCTQ